MITATEKQQMLWMKRLAGMIGALADSQPGLRGRPLIAEADVIAQEIDEWIANGGRKV